MSSKESEISTVSYEEARARGFMHKMAKATPNEARGLLDHLKQTIIDGTLAKLTGKNVDLETMTAIAKELGDGELSIKQVIEMSESITKDNRPDSHGNKKTK